MQSGKREERKTVGRGLYAAIDLKSFYASVECVERRLDPLCTNLVVADASRTDKTICLAVSPSLKARGVSSRPRLFEVIAAVREINSRRRWSAPGKMFSGSSFDDNILKNNPSLSVDYITAPPRMSLYIDYSTRIYSIYLKYFAPEDIHVYSIDEVFINIEPYLKLYKTSARELIIKVIYDILNTTGITATAGIGTNLYLAKVAMDIVAKRIKADKFGVRIAELDEISYRKLLWDHTPLTDFWRVGSGYRKRLESHGMYTMGDIALVSMHNRSILYKLFGVNAELLIDHAWGYEPVTINDVREYRPETKSISSGQVLSEPYSFDKAELILREMSEGLALDMMKRGVVSDKITLTVCYEAIGRGVPVSENTDIDRYGRVIPKHSHGTVNLARKTYSAGEITKAVIDLYRRIAYKNLLVRRLNLSAEEIVSEESEVKIAEQISLFPDFALCDEDDKKRRDRDMQKAVLSIKERYGRNSILRGLNFLDGATAIERNSQIGGHKA